MKQTNPSQLSTAREAPRHAHEEIADLVAVALLRLRALPKVPSTFEKEPVSVDLCATPRVTTNPYENKGVLL